MSLHVPLGKGKRVIKLIDSTGLMEGSHRLNVVLAGGGVGFAFALLVDAALASMVLFAYGVLFTFEGWCLPYTS